MTKRLITIAIDGFSSSGKSTMAKVLAKNIGYAYIDSGAMYRAVTLYCLDNGLINEAGEVDLAALEAALGNINISFGVNAETGAQLAQAGADVLVAGSYVFSTPDPEAAIRSLKEL